MKEYAVLLGMGKGKLPFSGCADHIHDRLRLGECHFSGEKRPFGEFARFCRDSAGGVDRFQQLLGDKNASVAGKLHGVLAGIAVGRTEHGGDPVIQLRTGRVAEFAVGAGVAGHFG